MRFCIFALLVTACNVPAPEPQIDWRCAPIRVCASDGWSDCDDAPTLCGCPARWPVLSEDCLACTDGHAVYPPEGVSQCLRMQW